MKLKKILAVGTAMFAVSAIIPTPIVQKCVSIVFADESLTYGDFTYTIRTRLTYNEETDEFDSYEYAAVFGLSSSAFGDIVIPDEIEGYKVEAVYFDGIFYNRNDITSITFPKYLESAERHFSIPEDCEIKIPEDCENFSIENDFLIQSSSGVDSFTGEQWSNKAILRSVKHLSGEVTVPEGVTYADSFAGNADITVINLPSTISYLDWYFCADMPSLKAINVSKDNEKYFSYKGALGKNYQRERYFYDEKKKDWESESYIEKTILAVPEGYEGVFVVDDGDALTISGASFENVSKIKAVELGKDTVFNCNGFTGCYSLEDIKINGEVRSISGIEKWYPNIYDSKTNSWVTSDEVESFDVAKSMFQDTKWYQDQPEGVLYCGNTIIGYKGTPKSEKIDVKDGTRTIVDKAFNGLEISELNVPASVEYIGAYALDCPTLKAVNIDSDNKNYASDKGVVYDKEMKMLKLYPQAKTDETYTIPEGVEVLAANACDGNKFIKHVDIPDSVNCIFGYDEFGGAFKNCTSLKDFIVPNGLTFFDTGAIYNCKLNSLDLSETVGSYDGDANCDYLIFRNPQCMIEGMNNCTIVGLKGSNAEAFANEHQIPFILLDDYDKDQATTTTITTSITTTATTTTSAVSTSATASTQSVPVSDSSTTSSTTNAVTTTTTVSITSTTASSVSTTASESSNPDINSSTETNSTTSSTTTQTTTSTAEATTTTETTTTVQTQPAVSFGDPTGDGKIDANDASFTLVEYAKMSTGGVSSLTSDEIAAADINEDGKVDSKDASIILAYYAYLSTGGKETLEQFLNV